MYLSKKRDFFSMANNFKISESIIPNRLLTYTINHRIRLRNVYRVIITENVTHILSAIGPSYYNDRNLLLMKIYQHRNGSYR